MRAPGGFVFGAELDPDAAQPFLEELRLAAQPYADIALQTEVRSGYDQNTLLDANTLAEVVTRGGRVVLQKAQRAGLRLAEGQEVAEALHPRLHRRQILLQDGAGTRVEFLAILGLHR